VISPSTIRCPKCGAEFDPRVQSAACHKGVRHYPIVPGSEWWALPARPADRPKQRPLFQWDFRELWNEPPAKETKNSA